MNILTKEYYFPNTFGIRLIISASFGITVLLILLLFTPFGMDHIKTFPERCIVASGYSLIAFTTWFLSLSGLVVLKINKIQVLHILLFIITIQFIIGSLSTIYNNIVFRNPYYFEFFIDLQVAVYLTGIIPAMMLFLLLETSFYKRFSMDTYMKTCQIADSNHRVEVKLEDENPEKNISLFADEILWIASMDNYIKIESQNNGEKKKPLILRNTLKNVEKRVMESGVFIRCHKSYIVNLQWVREVTGNSLSKKCVMQIGNESIPISRSKVDVVFKKIHDLK